MHTAQGTETADLAEMRGEIGGKQKNRKGELIALSPPTAGRDWLELL